MLTPHLREVRLSAYLKFRQQEQEESIGEICIFLLGPVDSGFPWRGKAGRVKERN